ncbi:MAG: DUF5686 family protein, partial [Weeksellaceae bacterium]|nr:DUF5686 family protein [Weeksellaceae bacterium]
MCKGLPILIIYQNLIFDNCFYSTMYRKFLPAILILFCCGSIFAQQKIKVIESLFRQAVPHIMIYDLQDNQISQTDEDGFFIKPSHISHIRINTVGYPVQEFMLNANTEEIVLEATLVSLSDVVLSSGDESANKLIREVIERQSANSPTSLPNYQFSSYTKMWMDAAGDSIPKISNPQSTSDSAQNRMKDMLQKSMFFMSERATDHYFDKSHGKKNIVRAARISGVQTPMFELMALQPVTYEFNQNKFNFVFRSFDNPVSSVGMRQYEFMIRDTINTPIGRMIDVMFKSKSSESSSLHGNLLIHSQSKALTSFVAETETRRGSYTYMEVKYAPYEKVWIPDYQFFRLQSNNFKYAIPRDSIDTAGNLHELRDKGNTQSWMMLHTEFSDFQSPVELERRLFRGYENEVPGSAFRQFQDNIGSFRTDSLSDRELNTYATIDSLGQTMKIDRMVKLMRIMTSGGFLRTGFLDWDLKEVYSGNQWEDFRFGLWAKTNEIISPWVSLNGRVYFGTRDKAFKYGFGSAITLDQRTDFNLLLDYSDDIQPMGRHKFPLLTPTYYLIWLNEVAGNGFYVDHRKYSIGLERDFFRNLSARWMLERGWEKSLFEHQFADFAPDHQFGIFKSRLALRYAPNQQFINTESGKFSFSDPLPIYRLMFDNGFKSWGGETAFTRLEAHAMFTLKLVHKPSQFYFKAGKMFGDAPIWEYFDGGGNSRPAESIIGRARFGGSNTFETMTAGEFISDTFLYGQVRQGLFNVPFFGNRKWPLSAIYKIGYGTMNDKHLHQTFDYTTLDNIYQEAGLELNGILLGMLGVGTYYRMGNYNYGTFAQDFSIKVLFNLQGF